MTQLAELNRSLAQTLTMADISLPPLFTVSSLPQAPNVMETQEHFAIFKSLMGERGMTEEDLSTFETLLGKMAQHQTQLKEVKARIDTLSSMKGHKTHLEEATQALASLQAIQKTIDAACYKPQGYIKRLFGNESWDAWSSARTDLGQLIILASDYTHGGLSKISLAKKLSHLDLNQASQEAERLLSTLQVQAFEDEASLLPKLDARQLTTTTANASTFMTALGGASQEDGYALQVSKDGGWVLTGYTDSFGAGSKDVLVVKVDATGDLVWARAIGRQLSFPVSDNYRCRF